MLVEATMSQPLSKDAPESMLEEAGAAADGALPLVEADAFLLPAMEAEVRRKTGGRERR